MATYSKETALYDTGAIGAGIAGAESNGKREATNYIYAGSDGIKIANADPEHADTYQKQTADSTEFYVDGVKRSSVSGSGFDVFAEDGSIKNASFGATAVISSEDANTSSSIKIEPSEISIWKNDGKRGVIAGEPFGDLENPIFFGKLYDYSYIEDGIYCAKSAVVISSSKRTGVDSEQRSTISITPDSIKISAHDNCYIGQVFNWQGNLKSNLTANAGAYVEGGGSITLKGGHTYLVLAYVAMTNSTNGTVDRRAQIFNKTSDAAILTGGKFVASQAWGTVETQTIYEASADVTLTVRGSASRPTTTIPTAWIRAVCLS